MWVWKQAWEWEARLPSILSWREGWREIYETHPTRGLRRLSQGVHHLLPQQLVQLALHHDLLHDLSQLLVQQADQLRGGRLDLRLAVSQTLE